MESLQLQQDDPLLNHEVIPELCETVLSMARQRRLLSEEHFSADGTLIKAWAPHKSFRPKDDDEGGHWARSAITAVSGARMTPMPRSPTRTQS
jgi:hypothetical protein